MAVPARAVRRLIAVGQLSVDTVIMLDTAILVGDGHRGVFTRSLGGTGAIVAYNAAVLGHRPVFVGHIGRTTDDEEMRARLLQAGVIIGATCGPATGLRVNILVTPDGERTMVSNGESPDWSAVSPEFHRDDVVFFEGWHLFDANVRKTYLALIDRASRCGATVVLDVCAAGRSTNPDRHGGLLRSLRVDIMLANEIEAEVYRLLTGSAAPLVVIHRGEAATRVLQYGRVREFPVAAVAALDTSGAGDAFSAGFLTALCRGKSIAASVRLGHYAARRVVQVVGPLLPIHRSVITASAASRPADGVPMALIR